MRADKGGEPFPFRPPAFMIMLSWFTTWLFLTEMGGGGGVGGGGSVLILKLKTCSLDPLPTATFYFEKVMTEFMIITGQMHQKLMSICFVLQHKARRDKLISPSYWLMKKRETFYWLKSDGLTFHKMLHKLKPFCLLRQHRINCKFMYLSTY